MEIQHRSQLVDLMKHFELPMTAAELGVAEGLFSRDLLGAGLSRLYSVDAWMTLNQKGDGGSEQEWHDNNYENVLELMRPFGKKSVLFRGISYEVGVELPDESLGLVYVDCDHSYEGVSKDIRAWWPKLVQGGIMAFHDYEATQYGVKDAVKDFCKENNIEIHLIPENKIEDAGAWIRKD